MGAITVKWIQQILKWRFVKYNILKVKFEKKKIYEAQIPAVS
jgi:hypothetical protein